ncbi:MAG: beta-phosphoglucomutase family hydrolase [Pseudomonadota bacterium]
MSAKAVSKPLPDLTMIGLDAFLFDLDGVVTRTSTVHARAWRDLFDGFLAARAGKEGFTPFRLPDDYIAYVDGKPRYDGVRSFLASRAIDLPWGTPQDPPDALTVCGLGNRKDQLFADVMRRDGVEVFEGTVSVIKALRTRSLKIGCVSSSKNCRPVLERAALIGLFDTIVDGNDLEHLHLAGKPAPDTYLHGAELLGAAPDRAAVIEDAVAGVAAGAAGKFKLVIGVDRGAGHAALLDAGADIVVDDMAEFAIG